MSKATLNAIALVVASRKGVRTRSQSDWSRHDAPTNADLTWHQPESDSM